MGAIGDRLKEVRKFLKKSQQDFAETIGVKRTTYTGYENDAEVPMYVLMSLHWRYMLNVDYLMNGIGDMFNNEKAEMDSGNNLNMDISMDAKDVAMQAMAEKIQRLESENAELRRRLGIEESASA